MVGYHQGRRPGFVVARGGGRASFTRRIPKIYRFLAFRPSVPQARSIVTVGPSALRNVLPGQLYGLRGHGRRGKGTLARKRFRV